MNNRHYLVYKYSSDPDVNQLPFVVSGRTISPNQDTRCRAKKNSSHHPTSNLSNTFRLIVSPVKPHSAIQPRDLFEVDVADHMGDGKQRIHEVQGCGPCL